MYFSLHHVSFIRSFASSRAPAFLPNVPNCGLVGVDGKQGLDMGNALSTTDFETRIDAEEDKAHLARVINGERGFSVIVLELRCGTTEDFDRFTRATAGENGDVTIHRLSVSR